MDDVIAKTAEVAGAVAAVQADIDALHGNDIDIGLNLAGAAAEVAALDAALSHLGSTAAPHVLADTAAAAEAVAASSGDASSNVADAAQAAKAATFTYYGLWGILSRIQQIHVPLFGGALQDMHVPAIFAAASGMHMLSDAVIEFAGVVIPASIAFGAFALAAYPAVMAIKDQMTNLNTVATATGRTLYPLGGSFAQVAAQVQPQVYQLFGDALEIAGHNTGTFSTLATGAGQALDQLGARFVVAITQGSGMGSAMSHAASDLLGLGNVVGNIGGIFGNFMKVVPGYAEDLLRLGGAATHVAESFTGWGPVQAGLKGFLAIHGALLYAGLAVTGLAKVIPPLLSGVANLGLKAAVAADGSTALGGALAKASGPMLGFAAGAEEAATLPWGWILTAAAGVGVLAYAMLSAQSATQQWLGSLQKTMMAASAVQGMNDLLNAQTQVAARLAGAQHTLGDAVHYANNPIVQQQADMGKGNQAMISAYQSYRQLSEGQQILADQAQLYNYRLSALARTYGGVANATGLLTAAGVPMSQMLTKSSQALAEIKAEVLATADAYRAMGQTGGTLGADMRVLNFLSSDQYTAMSRLNQAWSQYLGLSTSTVTGIDGVITGMRQLDQEMKNSNASFTGVNTASINLQNSFEQNFSTLQNVIGGMRMAHDSTSQLASVMSTALLPSVKDGALANIALRTQIFSMAQEAGYAGPDKIAPLKAFIDGAATSLSRMAQEARNAAAAENALHSKDITITTYFRELYSVSGTGRSAQSLLNPGYQWGTDFATMGMHLVGERGPELVYFHGGEGVLPASETRQFLAGGAGGGHARSAAVAGPATALGEAVIHVHVHQDGQQVWQAQQRQTLIYNRRNGNQFAGAVAPPTP
jgi:hypothetical protein